jgi:hypothetical protein
MILNQVLTWHILLSSKNQQVATAMFIPKL